MKLFTFALIPLAAGLLSAQAPEPQNPGQNVQTQSTTTTSTVNLTGTLLDQGCYSTKTESKESSGNTTTQTTKIVTECPVTTTTTSFGLLTPDGKFIRFDDAGNTRVVGMMKSNKDWQEGMSSHKPITVHVMGAPNGDVFVIREIK